MWGKIIVIDHAEDCIILTGSENGSVKTMI